MKVAALGGLALSFVMILVGVFFTVLCVVMMFKILQIAEDLRYIRSKTDIHVERPKPYTRLVIICVIVSAGICLLLFGALVTFGAGMVANSGTTSSILNSGVVK